MSDFYDELRSAREADLREAQRRPVYEWEIRANERLLEERHKKAHLAEFYAKLGISGLLHDLNRFALHGTGTVVRSVRTATMDVTHAPYMEDDVYTTTQENVDVDGYALYKLQKLFVRERSYWGKTKDFEAAPQFEMKDYPKNSVYTPRGGVYVYVGTRQQSSAPIEFVVGVVTKHTTYDDYYEFTQRTAALQFDERKRTRLALPPSTKMLNDEVIRGFRDEVKSSLRWLCATPDYGNSLQEMPDLTVGGHPGAR